MSQARFGRDRSNRGAALLLMKVRMIAIDEVCCDEAPMSPLSSSSSSFKCVSMTSSADRTFLTPRTHDSALFMAGVTSGFRCRTVSFCSQDIDGTPRLSPRFSISPSFQHDLEETTPLQHSGSNDLSTTHSQEDSSLYPTTSSDSPTISFEEEDPLLSSHAASKKDFVGQTIPGPVKAMLRKKFSWKSYPELESYLIRNRHKYLQYSSSLNYTAEQKRYNNRLTQGLLDVAAREGYRFEDFTFAAVRDRIRCYYKSYVQAVKKKKRKKAKRSS